jgi:hypothetical protein
MRLCNVLEGKRKGTRCGKICKALGVRGAADYSVDSTAQQAKVNNKINCQCTIDLQIPLAQ